MSRELNLQVFEGELRSINTEIPDTKLDKGPSIDKSSQDLINSRLVEELQGMKRRMRELESQVLTANSRNTTLKEMNQKSHIQMQQAYRNLEDVMRDNFQKVSGKISQVSGKLTEQRVNDSKTHELIDRHNQIVQKFEARLQEMQKLISQQEMKILNYQSILDEMRRKR